MSASSSDRPNVRFISPTPAGGMASPPSDPPAASPTPLRGQVETNRESENRQSSTQPSAGERNGEEMRSAAYEFGWQSRLQYGSVAATQDATFEKVEPELEKLWSLRQATKGSRMPWQTARETARDAWNQVYDAIAGDSSAKTKTNG
jgi:hypothetical protein